MLIYRGKMNWENLADNEEFTVVLPYGTARLDDPIHLYWQWTKARNGETKVNVLCRTTVTGVTQTEVQGEAEFSSVYHDDYDYTFDITSKQNGEQLSIFVRRPAAEYTSKEMILQKISPSRVLAESDFPMSPERPLPRIYAGKLNWYGYAVNELFVVTLPNGLGKQYPVTAHWQWTYDARGIKKLNSESNGEQIYVDSNNQDANTFFFPRINAYYTFYCIADDDSQTLKVTMKSPTGDTRSTTLQLQEIIDTTSKDVATIINDTSDLVMCTFSPSVASAGGRILAVGGFGVAAIGFVPVIVPSFPTPYGWAIALVGAGISALGVVDMALVAEDASSRTLFPGDAASNDSSGRWFISCNSVSVIRAFIETVACTTQLVIRSGKATDVREVIWCSRDSPSLQWSEFARITLPKVYHIKTYRGLKIKCLKPNWDGVTASSTDNSTPPDQYTLFTGSKNSEVLRYGIQIGAQKASDEVLFNCVSPDCYFTVTQGFGPNQKVSPSVGDYYMTPLKNGTVAVKISNCKIIAKQGSNGTWKVTTKSCSKEEEVLDEIRKNPGFFAYGWSPGDKKLYCWPQSQANQVVKDAQGSTFFVVPGIDVKTVQYMFEGNGSS